MENMGNTKWEASNVLEESHKGFKSNESTSSYGRTLDALLLVLPLVPAIVGCDLQISLCNRKQVIGLWQAKTFHLPGATNGAVLVRENPAHKNMLEAMENGKSRMDILPKELLGEPIKGIVTPVFEDGKVVGVIACASSLKEADNIKTSSENLFTNLMQTQNAVEEIASGSSSLAEKIFNINQAVETVTVQVKNALACVTSIQKNAGHSGILALNGSIEAARAGEAGRGFTIIANEMRNFSKVSSDTAKVISDSLNNVASSVTIITNEVYDVNEVATQQAAATQEITAALNDITGQASKLVEYNKDTNGIL